MNILSWNSNNINSIAKYLLAGNVAVLPTDTLYGLVAVAKDPAAVAKVYNLKGRDPAKPVIILISDLTDLSKLQVEPTVWQKNKLNIYWPGKVSMILACDQEDLAYLHRGTKTLAFRLPGDGLLRELIRLTGPLIAPSANPEGMEPAIDISKAQRYFGDAPLYVDGGEKQGSPSTLLSLIDDKLVVLRGNLP